MSCQSLELATAAAEVLRVYEELTTGVLDIESALCANEWHAALDRLAAALPAESPTSSAGPIVNGEQFAPGYTTEAAAYEQRTR